MTIYWSHITGVNVLLIAQRGLLLVITIATDVGGREREREMKNPQTLQSLFQQFQHRDHRSRTPASSEEHWLFLLSIRAAFLCSCCRQRLSVLHMFPLPLDAAAQHLSALVYMLLIHHLAKQIPCCYYYSSYFYWINILGITETSTASGILQFLPLFRL